MADVVLEIWGRRIALRGFPAGEVAEVRENFAGSLAELPTTAPASLILHRQAAEGRFTGGVPRPRHRGGSAARKFFLDGSRYDGGEQHRDIDVVTEGPGVDVYAWHGSLVSVHGDSVTVACPGAAPSMLLCDIIEDWLLCASRRAGAVQVHCAAWTDEGQATLVVGSSGVGKTTELFRRLREGSSFLSNDRAFLRMRDGRLQVRSFPLPVNVGCGTIRALNLEIPHHDLTDHDKIRMRPPEVAARFGADYDTWFPVSRVICTSLDDLHRNVYWEQDDCHPFWIRGWRPGPLEPSVVDGLAGALSELIVEQSGLVG